MIEVQSGSQLGDGEFVRFDFRMRESESNVVHVVHGLGKFNDSDEPRGSVRALGRQGRLFFSVAFRSKASD
jgi:hypothetical protein